MCLFAFGKLFCDFRQNEQPKQAYTLVAARKHKTHHMSSGCLHYESISLSNIYDVYIISSKVSGPSVFYRNLLTVSPLAIAAG